MRHASLAVDQPCVDPPRPHHALLPLLRYVDVVLVLLAAPLLLLIGAPALGYGLGGTVWIALRGLGAVVDRHASTVTSVTQLLTLRIGYRLVRILFLVTATVVALKAGRNLDGLTALLVITFAFTAELITLLVRRRRPHR